MRRKPAKEILAESFREFAETIPIDKITIKDIVYNYDYSPATFKDKYGQIAFVRCFAGANIGYLTDWFLKIINEEG